MTTQSLFKQRRFASRSSSLVHKAYISDRPSVLSQWQAPDCQLALWHRQLAPDFVRHLDVLPFEALPSARFAVTPASARCEIEAALAASPLKDKALQVALTDDMERLVTLFADATGWPAAEVRIEAVQGDACRLFHTDAARARLVTSYIGPGTVWVPPDHAEEAVSLQDEYRGPAAEMPRFAVGLFRGHGSKGTGLVHRSPRIAGTGTFRLFFCINIAARTGAALH